MDALSRVVMLHHGKKRLAKLSSKRNDHLLIGVPVHIYPLNGIFNTEQMTPIKDVTCKWLLRKQLSFYPKFLGRLASMNTKTKKTLHYFLSMQQSNDN